MKKLLFVFGIAVLVAPMSRPMFGQDDISITDISNILNGGGNNNRGNRGPQIPDSHVMFADLEAVLKKGKTPLEGAQKKPLQSLLDTEIVALSDRIQNLRNNNNNNNQNNQSNTQNRGGNNTQQNNTQNNQPSETAIKVETITSLSNDDFLNTKLALFLTPEQVALVQKAKADDKDNSTCLGGLFDRYYNQMQSPNRNNSNQNSPQGRGGNNFPNNNNSNNTYNNQNSNNNQKRPNGLKYCMTIDATPADRLEPIRKVLEKGKMPLAADKVGLAEIVIKSQLPDLEASLRKGLTSNNNNNQDNRGRGGNQNNNNSNNLNKIIQTTTDNMYRKIEAMLKPEQAETIKMYHYTQMLSRNPIEALIAVNAMQDTPLSDEQIAKVTAAWPEFQRQIEDAARAAKVQISQQKREGAAMVKILDLLEPAQVASYQLAKKYGPEAAAAAGK